MDMYILYEFRFKLKYVKPFFKTNYTQIFSGAEGIKALSHAIVQDYCEVKVINLRLNLFGDQGVKFLFTALENGSTNVKSLSIPGCGITGKTLFTKLLLKNNMLEKIDISNNRIGRVSITKCH